MTRIEFLQSLLALSGIAPNLTGFARDASTPTESDFAANIATAHGDDGPLSLWRRHPMVPIRMAEVSG